MKILALDSSAGTACCAILEDSVLIGEFFINTKQTHSQTLMPMVQSLLSAASTDLSDIDLFAVSAGPGSFTGLRIGVSAVKGLAFATGKPCIGVSTLQAMCMNPAPGSGYVCAVMNARREQVYTATYRLSDLTKPIYKDDAIPIEELAHTLAKLEGEITLVGDGAVMCCEKMKDTLPNISVARETDRYGRGYGVGLAALLHMSMGGESVSASELAPVYLRLSQAERELLEKEGLQI